MKATLRAVAAVILILVIAVCGILIVEKLFKQVRADLTEHHLYTLSRGTRNILSQINQPVRLKLYYSKMAALKGPEGIRYYNNYYLYVRDLLQEYVDRSGNHLQLTVIDPRRFSDDEDEALRLGVRRFPLEGDDSFFFGLVAQTELGQQAVIPFFEPERQEFVEYDLSKLITTVTRREKKRLGILCSMPNMCTEISPYMAQMMQLQRQPVPQPWVIVTQLRSDYEVVAVEPDAESIGEDLDFLMIVHPKELPRKTLFAIDQFVMKGGRLLVFVDPHCLVDRPSEEEQRDQDSMMEYNTASDLNALLRGWGVEMEPGAIVADRTLAVAASVTPNTPAQPIVTFVQINQQCVNPDEVVAARLHSLRMLFAGALKPVEGAGTVVTPLLETTDSGVEWTPATKYELYMFNPETVTKAVANKPEKRKLMLGCRISGTFKSNFPDGLPVAETKAGEPQKPAAESGDTPAATEALKSSAPDAQVLVFSDVDMISDNIAYNRSFFGMSPVGDNASLVMNALDFLGGSGDLIAVRSRGAFNRPFKVVDAIEAEAEKASADKVEALQKKIEESEAKLRKLGIPEDEQEVKILQSTAMSERKQILEELRRSRKELRQVNAEKREKIESLKARLQTENMVWAPAVVLLIAVVLAVVRFVRSRRYARRRV
jgi:ABC-type uncharacterized transport system involved in gliding motility auxiliary subunit